MIKRLENEVKTKYNVNGKHHNVSLNEVDEDKNIFNHKICHFLIF